MNEDRADSQSFHDVTHELVAEEIGFRFRARGHSMSPTIQDGDVLHVTPVVAAELDRGDIVLYRTDFGIRAHRIVALNKEGEFMTRGDAAVENDPVVSQEQIIGRVIAKEPCANGRFVRLDGPAAALRYRGARARRCVSRCLHSKSFLPPTVPKMLQQISSKAALALILFICLCSVVMHAQVAVDASLNATANVTNALNNPLNLNNFTTGTGVNRLLVVGVSINRQGNTAVVVGGITYNGAALVPLGAQNDPTGFRRVEMWYLINPPSGTATVSTTFANVSAIAVGAVVGAITFTGVDQTDPFRDFVGANAAGGSPSVTVASGTGDLVLDTVAATGDRAITALGANQTTRWNNRSANNPNPGVRGFGTTEPGGNVVTMSETLGGTSSSWAQGAVAIRPAGAVSDFGAGRLTGATPTLTFSHTSSGTSAVLVVGVSMNITNAATATVSGVTFNGVALTRAGFRNDTGNTRRVEMWYLIAPPVGTFNVVVTLNPLAATIGVAAGAETFTGIDQSQPVRTFASSAGTNVALSSLDITSNYGDTVLDTLAIGGPQTVTAWGPSQTSIWNLDSSATPTAATDVTGAGSTRAGAPSVPLSETFSANSNWAMGALALQPSNADVAVTNVPTSAFNPGPLTYTLTVTNNGPSQATGVVVTDTLAAGLTLVSATSTQGTCPGTTTITCNVGTLANGSGATITIVVTPAAVGGYPNNATVTTSGTPPDLNTGNNSAMSVAYSESNACAVPANPPAGGTLAGVINTYYPSTANVAAGATSIPVGTSTGSTTTIANGDLLLVIQMQDAAINTTNGPSYGDGGDGGGYTNLNNSGIYEFVKAIGGVTAGAVPISGAGPGGGLLFSYTNAAATATQGQRRFQVIRVPQYSTATLSSTLTAAPWNGTSGGVLAVDIASTLTLNGATVSVDGLGFRGGAGLRLSGATGSNQDFVHAAPAGYAGALLGGADAPKGEGIAGTPLYVESGGTFLNTGSAYPSGTAGTDGSSARGAPGNAGGGGTDANPGQNNQNAGGGGGGNGGFGGSGGDAWNTNLSSGGIGGSAVPASGTRLVMGGGGGGGTRNDSGTDNEASGGSSGGGIVLIRAGGMTGTATITANGVDAYNGTANDAGGGGGAGGTILITSIGGGLNGLTLAAHGGRGGDAWNTQAFSLADRHGPGGGGGGGVILTSTAVTSPDVNAGANGLTLNPGVSYGASPGTGGVAQASADLLQTPGIQSAPACIPDLIIAKAHTGNFLRGSTTAQYRITVTNAALAGDTTGTVTVTDTLPAGLTPTAASGGATWSCGIVTQTVTCTTSTPLAGGFSYPVITVTVTVSQTAASSVTNTAMVAGGGELNTTNDTATDVTTIVSSSDLSIVKTASVPSVRQNVNFTYTLTVTNNGPSNATNVTTTDALPSAVTYVSATSTQGTCSQAAGTVTCNIGAMNNGAVVTVTITVTATTPGVVTNTATVTRTEPDPVTSNNSSSVTITIVFPTQVSLETFTASTDVQGVMLSWSTSGEIHNLGFNIYREENGRRILLNPSLVAGSALTLRSALPQHGARTYAWLDRSQVSGASYWLEDVDLDGTRTLHGPVTPQSTVAAARVAAFAMSSKTRMMAQAKTLLELSSEAVSSAPAMFNSQRLQAMAARPNNKGGADKVQFQLAAGPAVKIAIDHEGWYKITQPQLVSAGLNLWADPKNLQLFADGVEQAIRVSGAGFGPGGFGAQAAIEFYGTGIDTPYSAQHVYWLVAGDRPGKRIGQWTGAVDGGPQAQDFPATVELKQRTTFFAALLREDTDNFFGALVSPTPVDQVLATPNLAQLSSGDAHLKVVIQGGTDNTTHDIQVSLNGSTVGTIAFANQQEGQIDVPVPNTLLQPNNNTVTLTAQNGQNDLSLVDFVQLTYPHSYVADSDFLRFTANAGDHVKIAGFSQPPARVLDITDPTSPVLLQSKVHSDNTGYSADIRVPVSVTQQHTLLALTQTQFALPTSLVPNAVSSWHNYSGADFVVVSAPAFLDQMKPLADLHRKEGHTVAVVSVDDIYDEFNFGEKDPNALKQFLQTASTNWRRKPASLLLVGDASFDPRNYLGLGDFDFVPTKLIPTSELKTSSDDWFSDFSNTGFAQINTGRLPVRTVDDANTAVTKTVGYASGPAPGSWTSQALLVADTDGDAGAFSQQAQTIQSLLPATIAATDVFVGTLGPAAARQAVLDGINSGKLLVNYNGHGSVQIWSGADLLDSTAAASLSNGSRLPVFVVMNCLNGYFHDLYTQSLAEALLLSRTGGGVAIWASSGLTSADPQFQLDQRFTSAISSQPTPTLGDAIRSAKQGIADIDVRRTFLLFGDPLLRPSFPGAGAVLPSIVTRPAAKAMAPARSGVIR